MPRDGSGVWSPPPGTTAVANEVIASTMWNALKDDIAADLNAPRPMASGGTGGTSASTARTNLGVVPQASVTDGTAGRLMTVGAFGLGGTDAVALPGDDLNLVTRTGVYVAVSGDDANVPGSGYFTVWHMERDATRAAQVAIRNNTAAIYYRTMDSSTWGAWRQIDGADVSILTPATTATEAVTVTGPSQFRYYNLSVGAGAYIYTVALSRTGAHEGDVIKFKVVLPSSTNPSFIIKDGGNDNLLISLNTATSKRWSIQALFTGAQWMLSDAHEMLAV